MQLVETLCVMLQVIRLNFYFDDHFPGESGLVGSPPFSPSTVLDENYWSIFWSTLRQSRPKKLVSDVPLSICTCMCAYVRPSTKSLVDFSEMCLVGRRR